MATRSGGTIGCDSKGEVSVADILKFINGLVLNSGQGWTKPEADARFVFVKGDTMTGHLTMKSGAKINLNGVWLEGKSGKTYQNNRELLDYNSGLPGALSGPRDLHYKGKVWLGVQDARVHINYNNGASTFMDGGNRAWHAGNSKGIRTRLVGNTLYMTDNQTNP